MYEWCRFPKGVPWVRYHGFYKDLQINLVWPGKDQSLGKILAPLNWDSFCWHKVKYIWLLETRDSCLLLAESTNEIADHLLLIICSWLYFSLPMSVNDISCQDIIERTNMINKFTCHVKLLELTFHKHKNFCWWLISKGFAFSSPVERLGIGYVTMEYWLKP